MTDGMSLEDEKKARPKTRGIHMTEIEEDLEILRDAMKDKGKSSKRYHQIVKTEYFNIKIEDPIPYDEASTDDSLPARKKHTRRGRHKIDASLLNGGRKGKGISRATSATAAMTPLNTSRLFHKSEYYQVGDIVSIMGEGNKLYFCQIRGFLRDSSCRHHISVRWLLPIQRATKYTPWPGVHGGLNKRFNPSLYSEGPEQEAPISIDLVSFVMHPPCELFACTTNPVIFDESDKAWDTPTQTMNSSDRRF